MLDRNHPYLKQLRQDPQFQRLIRAFEIPEIPAFAPGKEMSEKDWIYGSGRRAGVDSLLAYLLAEENDE